MTEKVFQLPGNRPLVWATPEEFHIGVDHPYTRVGHVPAAATPLIHALGEGISSGGIRILQQQLRLSPAEVSQLLEQIEPAYDSPAPETEPPIVLVGDSPALPVMAGVLDAMGLPVTRIAEIGQLPADHPGGVILVADYVSHPDWVSALGPTDIPHTPVIFSDLTIRIGPHVAPGLTPCLSCIEQQRRATTPDWLAIDSQLWSTRSPLSTPELGARAAVFAALCHGAVGSPDAWGLSPGLAIDYRPDRRSVSFRQVDFDPHCTCRGFEASGAGSNAEGREKTTHLPV